MAPGAYRGETPKEPKERPMPLGHNCNDEGCVYCWWQEWRHFRPAATGICRERPEPIPEDQRPPWWPATWSFPPKP